MAKKPTNATKKEIERFHAWLATEDPLSIVTHLYVDADAVFSAALLSVLKPNAQVLFVPADSEIEDTRTLGGRSFQWQTINQRVRCRECFWLACYWYEID